MQLGTQLWPKPMFPGKARQCNLHIPPFATIFRFPLGGGKAVLTSLPLPWSNGKISRLRRSLTNISKALNSILTISNKPE